MPPPNLCPFYFDCVNNPDEFVWQHVKTNGVAKKPLKQKESLKERVKAGLASVKANKKLARSFFHAPSVAYAKDL